MTDKEGIKFDQDKPDWSLLPLYSLEEVVKVLDHGAKKYGRDNWRYLGAASNRYFAAAMRHLAAWQGGELKDPETGYSHLAHATCNLIFLLWWEPNAAAVLEELLNEAEPNTAAVLEELLNEAKVHPAPQ